VYEVFNHQPDRVELVESKIWTVNEARAEIRIRNGTAGLGNSDDDSGWNDRSDLVGKHSPCIYRLLNDSGRVIRVGQAKGDLRKRLNGYHHESWWSEVAGVKTFAVPLQALTVAEANEIHRWHPSKAAALGIVSWAKAWASLTRPCYRMGRCECSRLVIMSV
jgi:hypothetical protein